MTGDYVDMTREGIRWHSKEHEGTLGIRGKKQGIAENGRVQANMEGNGERKRGKENMWHSG